MSTGLTSSVAEALDARVRLGREASEVLESKAFKLAFEELQSSALAAFHGCRPDDSAALSAAKYTVHSCGRINAKLQALVEDGDAASQKLAAIQKSSTTLA